jgi:hypothetical protein
MQRMIGVRLLTPRPVLGFALWVVSVVGMDEWCTSLKRLHVEGAAHWVQMEAPKQINHGILQFMEGLTKWTNQPVEVMPHTAPQRVHQPKSKL